MIDDRTLSNFRAKYASVHPLVFQRSLDRANSALELFEILESVPQSAPFSWDEGSRSWRSDEDMTGVAAMKTLFRKKR